MSCLMIEKRMALPLLAKGFLMSCHMAGHRMALLHLAQNDAGGDQRRPTAAFECKTRASAVLAQLSKKQAHIAASGPILP